MNYLAKMFTPFLDWIPNVRSTWKDDLIAGITGTIIVIPQAVAFAMIAGLPPVYGFYTAMITPIIAALFGSSYHLVSGPTTAISIVVYASVSKYVSPEADLEGYVALTLILTLLAGFIQLFMGMIRLGKLVNFVSHSVIVGFTAGAAFLIAFKQLKHIFDLDVPNGSNIFEIVSFTAMNIGSSNTLAVIIGFSTLFLAILLRKKLKRVYLLIAIIFGTVVAVFLGGEGAGISTVGDIPAALPNFAIPQTNWAQIRDLFPTALVLALLGLIEAVAIGKSIALKSHQKIDSNQEFVGQGLSNIVGSMFSAYAGSGSFTRSGVNYQAGAKSPLSAIIAAVLLGVVLLLVAPLASYLPKAAMGGVILLVAYNLIDFHHIKRIFKSSKREFVVFVVTFLGTILFAELELALLLGVLFSFLFYLEGTSNPNIATIGIDNDHYFKNIQRTPEAKECPQLKILRLDGSIYFGAIENISKRFEEFEEDENIHDLLILCEGVNNIDLAGAEWLTNEVNKFNKYNKKVHFVGLKLKSLVILEEGGFIDEIGKGRFFDSKEEAISTIYKTLDMGICETCEIKAFHECNKKA